MGELATQKRRSFEPTNPAGEKEYSNQKLTNEERHLNKPEKFDAELVPLSEANHFMGDWLRLAERAVDPTPYYSPAYLLASAKHLCPETSCQLVLVWQGDGPKKLVGLFPISVKGIRYGYLHPVCELWRDCVTGNTVPLISGETIETVETVWSCFLEFLARHPNLPDVLHCRELGADTQSGLALQNLVSGKGIIRNVENSHERAVAKPVSSYADYTKKWSKKRSRNLRAAHRKLAEKGTVTFENISQSDPEFSDALEELLKLEASGWKGQMGTAFNSQKDSRDFALNAFNPEILPSAALLTVIRLDGRIIAGLFNLVSQGHVFGVRSGIDVSLAQCSPGILAYTWLLENLLETGDYQLLDSCTDGNHLLNKYWLERKTIEAVYVTASQRSGVKRIDRIINSRRVAKTLRDSCNGLIGRIR
ncbi:GNAT family N-acetyltransferase [Roseibium sp.]|uniref:GNAT family N-acetyltransferase n=1 Tax=Roseibium sp. TaxID=1936156 RepID=UPI003B51F9E1